MANHASAKKRIRRNRRQAQVNKARIGRIRTFVKKIEQAIEKGDAKTARDSVQKAQKEMYKGVAKGVLHQNTAARKLSRLSSKIKDLKKA